MIVSGCLLDAFDRGEVDVIGHCCNAQGVMGSGIAKSIKERYPRAYQVYRDDFEGDRLISGSYSCAYVSRLDKLYQDGEIYNLVAQQDFGRGSRFVNYGALSKCLYDMSVSVNEDDIVGFPFNMASDRAGGDWDIVQEMIYFYFKDHYVRIYKL